MYKQRTEAGSLVVVIAMAMCLLHPATGQASDFRVALIGNSMLNMGIDFGGFSSNVQHGVDVKIGAGAMSLWKFCTLWYICKDAHRPKYVLIELRGTELTDPMNRNTYGRDAVGSDPELHAIVAKIEADPPPEVSGNHDFHAVVDRCYLPSMIEIARRSGVDLILARHKATSYRVDENAPHDAWWDTVMKYRQDLAAYCDSNGVFFLDYQFTPEIRLVEHYIYPSDDHLNYVGKLIWTDLLSADVGAILAGRQGARECTTFARLPGEWEAAYGLTARDGLDAFSDTDTDGVTNYAEYLADTNPSDPTSALGFVQAVLREGRLELTWRGGTLSAQHLEAITGLGAMAESWNTVRVYPPPTLPTNTFLEEGERGLQRFYRLRAERP